jgi:hypothetical protein
MRLICFDNILASWLLYWVDNGKEASSMEISKNNESATKRDQVKEATNRDFLKRSVENPGKEYKGNPGKEYTRPDLDKYHQ